MQKLIYLQHIRVLDRSQNNELIDQIQVRLELIEDSRHLNRLDGALESQLVMERRIDLPAGLLVGMHDLLTSVSVINVRDLL